MQGLIASLFIFATVCFFMFDALMVDREKNNSWRKFTRESQRGQRSSTIIEAKAVQVGPVITHIVPEVGAGRNLPAVIVPREEEWPNLDVGYSTQEEVLHHGCHD